MKMTSFAKLLRHDLRLPVLSLPDFVMFCLIVPAVICAMTLSASAQTITLPDLEEPQATVEPSCDNIPYSPENCVRVLACVGDGGVFFDGQAIGWDTGPVTGAMSDGVTCAGTWDSNGPGGTGLAQLSCSDSTTLGVVYYSQDNETGTVIGRGVDSENRSIMVWSGTNVLAFLSKDGPPKLPCMQGDIPIS